jgi:hypothetical protein
MDERAMALVQLRMQGAIRVHDVFTRCAVAFRVTKRGNLVYKCVGQQSEQRACVACYLLDCTCATPTIDGESTFCRKHAEYTVEKKVSTSDSEKRETTAPGRHVHTTNSHGGLTKNHLRLISHMRAVSHEKVDHVKMFAEWKFQSMHICKKGGGACPCGKKPILYECHLIHRQTGATTFVGSSCIDHFIGQTVLQKLVVMSKRYLVEGITMTYHSVDPKYEHKHRFVLRGNAKIVVLKADLDWYFDNEVPLFQMGNGKWLLKVAKNKFARTLKLQKGDIGTYRLKASTYRFKGNTGLCFYMEPW